MKIEQFRESRASELDIAAKRLESIFGSDINTTPIYNAIDSLKTKAPTLKNGTTNANFWGYSIEDLRLPVDTTKHLKPKIVDGKKVELILNMNLAADFSKWESQEDPLLELRFHVVVRGVSEKGEHFFCFHIDRHDPSIKTDEPHPIYHLQFFNNPHNDSEFDYGSTFHLDTPRILHYPVDFILGIGFITSNFFPFAFDSLMDDGYFPSLYTKYQVSFLKPFFHSISRHWEFDSTQSSFDRFKICPSFI